MYQEIAFSYKTRNEPGYFILQENSITAYDSNQHGTCQTGSLNEIRRENRKKIRDDARNVGMTIGRKKTEFGSVIKLEIILCITEFYISCMCSYF